MATKAMSNGRKPIASPPDDLIGGVSSFGGNLAMLASLQGRLFGADAKDAASSAAPGIGAVALAYFLVSGAMTVALAGAGLWVAQAAGWSMGLGLLAVAGVAIVVAGLLALFGLRRIQKSGASFRRSKEELERNIAWVQTVLSHSGR
jgi:uncharacterized membrane protein